MKLRPLDAITFGYFAVVALLVATFHDRVSHWYAYPLAFAATAAIACALIAAHQRHPANRAITLLRYVYPLVASPFVYGSIGGYVLVLRGHYLDAGMNAFETRIFGGHPTLALQHVVTPPITELLYACYFGFYLFFVIPPLVLFLRRRDRDLERYVVTLTAALYVCYLGFLIVPLLGPEYSLAGSLHPGQLRGYVVVPVQKFLMAHGDPRGACFPSAHVAGAWAGLYAIRRAFGRRTFAWLLAPTIGLTVAVIYTRYHYLTDAIGGLVVAVVVVAAVRFAAARRAADPPPAVPDPATAVA
jgi:hypothetical protein